MIEVLFWLVLASWCFWIGSALFPVGWPNWVRGALLVVALLTSVGWVVYAAAQDGCDVVVCVNGDGL